MRTGRLVSKIGFALAAGAIGAAGALLFAPQSGVRTRRLIGRKGQDFGFGARKAYERIKENGNSAARTLVYSLRLNLAPRLIRKALAR